jgi:N-acetylglucosaminyl-diphospho-decaprenol L-rhamnosyltransferase
MAQSTRLQAQLMIGVVIVSYNTVALLRACLGSLRGCRLPLRIVVVDNGSRDGSAAMVRTEFPDVDLLALEANPGFAGGNNRGLARLAQSTGGAPPYLLLLNPDTVVQAGAIESLVAFLEAHPRVGVVGPRLLNPDGTVQAAAFRFPTLLMTVLDLFPPGEILPGRLYGSWWHGRYPQERGAAPFPIDHPLGACMLVRREAIEEVGPLDERYFMYSEEIEWCWRIRRAGWAIWQVPAARVTHVGGAATGQFRHRMLVALWQSRDRFAAQRGPAWRLTAQRAIVRAGMLRLSLCAWRAYARGQLSRDELRVRLLAYSLVIRG